MERGVEKPETQRELRPQIGAKRRESSPTTSERRKEKDLQSQSRCLSPLNCPSRSEAAIVSEFVSHVVYRQ